MKKLFTAVLILLSLTTLTACGESKESVEAYRDRASYLTMESGKCLINISQLYLERGTLNLNSSQYDAFTKETKRLTDYTEEFIALEVPKEYEEAHTMMFVNYSYAMDSLENFLNAYAGGNDLLYDTALEDAATYFERVEWFFGELGYE